MGATMDAGDHQPNAELMITAEDGEVTTTAGDGEVRYYACHIQHILFIVSFCKFFYWWFNSFFYETVQSLCHVLIYGRQRACYPQRLYQEFCNGSETEIVL